MEFIKKLVETESSENQRKHDENLTWRGFGHLQISDVSLSVQASYAHYCNPRKTLKDLSEYTTMEFALIRNGEFASVKEVLPNFSALEEIEKYEDTVYGFVPVELIEKLYQELQYQK